MLKRTPKARKNLILCVHAHQPVGNFEWVIEEGYQKSYKPFFDVLWRHPRIKVSCHLSGSLIDWIEKHRPEFLTLLRKMAKRGQVEFLGGGYYEPIYGVIPKKDLIGQIGVMREKVKQLFGETPKGVWLTERVWDPDLIQPLKKALVEYTILDDYHLEKAGAHSPVTGYYQARGGKEVLDLFASMKELRYRMPFKPPQDVLDYIYEQKAGPEDAFVFADDIEKFGMWPGTYHCVYEEKWLEKFFTLLEKAKGIRLSRFGEFRSHHPSKGFVDVAHSSYSEMMEWSGGRFYNFFKKYPESEYMRDRMWQVSGLLQETLSQNVPLERLEDAREALYKAQCNCSYWHGVFGGLYLHHLRSAVFENLIRAEGILRRNSNHAGSQSATQGSLETLKSGPRWRIAQKNIAAFFNPGYGAALEELDYLPKSVNLMCNIQRQPERYHDVVLKKTASAGEGTMLAVQQILGVKEENLEEHLFYDKNRRLSYLDHFFDEELTLDAFRKSAYTECGDFVDASYKTAPRPAKSAGGAVIFRRKGHLALRGRKHSVTLEKTVSSAARGGLRVDYAIRNESPKTIDFVFGVEFNFSIGDDRAKEGLSEMNIRRLVLQDSWRKLKLSLSVPSGSDMMTAPVETISESESGLERTYQELAVLLQKRFHLKSKERKTHRIELTVAAA